MSQAELEAWCEQQGEPSYRGRQLYHWIYRRRAVDFNVMSDLSLEFRQRLNGIADISPLPLISTREGSDGTRKFLFEVGPGERIEAVIIPEDDRLTACLSSQVGCLVGCPFCATGRIGFRRNLTAGEVIGQFMRLESTVNREITNIVMMGMGEPLLNLSSLLRALKLWSDKKGMGFSWRRITVSTVGWQPGIEALLKEGIRAKLAISLNAVHDAQRKTLTPLAGRFSLKSIISAARCYAEFTGLRITLSYLLLGGVNDSPGHAERLARIARSLPSKVNLMEYNDIGSNFQRSRPEQVEEFQKVLLQAGVAVTMRMSRGGEISAACGQLAGEYV